MKLWRWLLLPALAALALLLYGGGPTSVAAPPDDLPDFAPGELLVKVKPGAQTSNAAAAIAGARTVERVPRLDVTRIELPPGMEVAEAVEFYERQPWVEFAEPNYYVRADVVPNDTLYAGSQSWYYNLIEGPAAWDVTTGSSSVVVAVVDTGVDLDHPDLDGKLEAGAAFISSPTPGCTSPPSNDPNDDKGHGTFVAGIIGAETNNGSGAAGTAWGVRLMPVKVLDCNGIGVTSDVAAGIAYAAANGAEVINLSLGGPRSSPAPCGSTYDSAINDAISAGAVLVAAAGNDNSAVSCPAAHTKVIAVGATDEPPNESERSGVSNYGPEIDVVAPGVNICSTWWKTGEGSVYGCGGGTSFAAPLVSGLAALILSQNSNYDYATVRSVICASAVDLADGSTPYWDGCGRIRMHTALVTTPPPVPGDHNGNGDTDLAVWRPGPGTWHVNGVLDNVQWGAPGDIPIPGDYNGDGKTDLAIWRPGPGTWHVCGVLDNVQWGIASDIPVPGDYDGDGDTDLAIWRPGPGTWHVNGVLDNVQWGAASDIPVPGDYDGDGDTDLAVWRHGPSTWHVNGVLDNIQWGTPGDIPVPGDYNGDGKTDLAVWRPSTGVWHIRGIAATQWGTASDIPMPAD